jgi:hypothetical protein
VQTEQAEPFLRSGDDGKHRIKFRASDVAADYEINIKALTRESEIISFTGKIKIEYSVQPKFSNSIPILFRA